MKTRLIRRMPLSMIALILAACATPPDPHAEAPFCHKDRGKRTMCTLDNAPSLSKDAEARGFQPDPDSLTLYVLRYWGGAHEPITIRVNDGPDIMTLPKSMVRYRLPAGSHKLSFAQGGKTFERTINGAAGSLLFVGIQSAAWPWTNPPYSWSDETQDRIQSRAAHFRLIKDIRQ